MRNGLGEIPIEERNADEIAWVEGQTAEGKLETVRLFPDKSPAMNYGFDVTPARLITGLITERGVCDAMEPSLTRLFEK
jgi:methylthioribose-1-phosphate isomerase